MLRPIDRKVEKEHIKRPHKNLKSIYPTLQFYPILQTSEAIRKFQNIRQQQTTKKSSPQNKQMPANTKSQLSIMASWLLLC